MDFPRLHPLTFIGCWRDSAVRAMKNIWFDLGSSATINKCIDICKKAGNLQFSLMLLAMKEDNGLGQLNQLPTQSTI